MLRLILLLTLALSGSAGTPPTLEEQIQAILTKSPVSANAYWGIEIADVSTGQPLFELNPDKFFVPASNTKLFTTALALKRLGPRFRIETTVQSAQPVFPDGTLPGDLILRGGGDPSLTTEDLDDLAAQAFASGIRQIDGNVIGDDTVFLWEPYSPGWSIDDAVEGYGGAVSALNLNDNAITLHVTPEGASLEPAIPLLAIDNQIETDEAGHVRIHYSRLPGSPNLRLWGVAHAKTPDPRISLGVDDPARYAALTFLDALEHQGIEVKGQAQAHHRFPGAKPELELPAFVVARHQSAPLIEDLNYTDKNSQNQHAEIYLRLVGYNRTGQGTREAGLNELQRFLQSAGIDAKQYNFADGSGLSRLNEVTPRAVVSLLTYMAKSPESQVWNSVLPIAGTDGTLENRMKTKRTRGHIIAKTGSLSHVSALSGYVLRTDGKRYAFSILANNFNGPAADIRDAIDKICSVLVDQ